MSKPMMIKDHKFFAGSGSPEFPKGVHVKKESDDGHGGHEMDYHQTTEDIKRAQEMGVKKMKAHKQKHDYRN